MLNIHVYPTPIVNESRMLKITSTLEKNEIFEEIELLGKYEHGCKKVEPISEIRKIVRIDPGFAKFRGVLWRPFKVFNWSLKTLFYLKKKKPQCINAHSLPVLPFCVLAKFLTGATLIYDTHELETKVIKAKGVLGILYRLTEKLFIRFCDEVSVVNKEIADYYQNLYSLAKVHVVENRPSQATIKSVTDTKEDRLRPALGLLDEDKVFLYQGLLSDGRGVDLLISAFQSLGKDYNLVFMGYGPKEEVIKQASDKADNIHFLPAVPPEELHHYTSGADVGLALIENFCESYYLCLPNKFYEYVSSNIPVITSDFPVMKRMVETLSCGWSVKVDKDALVELIQNIDPSKIKIDLERVKSEYSWEAQERDILSIYASITEQ